MRAAVAVLIALTPAPARAQSGSEPVRFAWVRAEGADACASQQQIEQRVTVRLGKSPFSLDAPRSIEAIVSRAEHGFRAGLYVRGKDGVLIGAREIASESADCASIEAACVLAIALAIDPEAITRPPQPLAPPPPAPPIAPLFPPVLPPLTPSPPLLTAPPATPSLPSATPSAEGLGGSGVALRGGLGIGLLPGPAPGASLAAHVALARPVQLTAEALWLPETRTSDGRFSFGLAALSLGACFTAASSPSVDLAACGAVWGGSLHAVVHDLQPAAPGDHAWAGASATPRLRVRLWPRVHAELGAHVLVPLVRRPFAVSGWADPVFRQAPVTVLAFAGLGMNFR